MTFVSAGVGVAQKRHRVTLAQPTTTPDGDGGYTESWTALAPPALSVNIRTVGAGDLERMQAGTISATATHVLTGDYHPGITTKTRITFGTRAFSVLGLGTPEEARAEVDIFCAEQIE